MVGRRTLEVYGTCGHVSFQEARSNNSSESVGDNVCEMNSLLLLQHWSGVLQEEILFFFSDISNSYILYIQISAEDQKLCVDIIVIISF